MKKIIYLFLAVSLCCGMWSCGDSLLEDGSDGTEQPDTNDPENPDNPDDPTPEIPIPDNMEEAFPDPLFREYVLENFDTDGDGKISQEEAAEVTKIDVSNKFYTSDDEKITSLEGVQYFTNLEELYCYYNQLTDLDVSQNAALTELRCYYNQLTSLDVSGCTALTQLYCDYNQLTSLDVSGCTALTKLECGNNQLTTLDVSKNTALTRLYCDYNPLTTIYMKQGQTITNLFKPDSTEIVYVD